MSTRKERTRKGRTRRRGGAREEFDEDGTTLLSVSIKASYGEIVDGERKVNYNAGHTMIFGIGSSKSEQEKWKDPDHQNEIRRYISDAIKLSIREEMLNDGIRTSADDEFEDEGDPDDDEFDDDDDDEDDDEFDDDEDDDDDDEFDDDEDDEDEDDDDLDDEDDDYEDEED